MLLLYDLGTGSTGTGNNVGQFIPRDASNDVCFVQFQKAAENTALNAVKYSTIQTVSYNSYFFNHRECGFNRSLVVLSKSFKQKCKY